MSEMNRREFVVATAACACACMLGGEADAQAGGSAAGPVDIGLPADFKNGDVSGKFISKGLIVARNDDKIVAMTAKCTHKNSTLGVKDNHIKCPSHGSTFSEQGTPTGGPAKAALFRYAIKLDDKGHLIVDKSKQFGEKQWEDAAASYKATA
jgi:nitrite reductase/ring-hydroxylating ferredoxin subunit